MASPARFADDREPRGSCTGKAATASSCMECGAEARRSGARSSAGSCSAVTSLLHAASATQMEFSRELSSLAQLIA